MPYNLETLCLCYTDQTSSEVSISSSNRDTIRKGGETAFSIPGSSLPRCRVIITQREVLIWLGILSNASAGKSQQKALGISSRLWRLWGKTPACSSISRLDAKRNPELFIAHLYFWCRDKLVKSPIHSHNLWYQGQQSPFWAKWACAT